LSIRLHRNTSYIIPKIVPYQVSIMSSLFRSLFGWNAILLVTLASTSAVIGSDQIPGAPQRKPILLRGGTIHTVSGDVLVGADLLFEEGKIKQVGKDIAVPEKADVVDVTGKHVYPGMIDSLSSIGLVEVESIRASVDTTEVGNVNPNVRALVAVNPDSEAIPVARANGVLAAVTVPSGGLVSGRAAMIMLDGWTWEDMTLQPDIGMIVNWPRFGAVRMGRGASAEADTGDTSDRLTPLHNLIRESKAYGQLMDADAVESIDLRLEAMQPVIRGEMPMLVVANTVKQIQTAVAFCNQYQLKMVLIGGADAHLCAPLLKESNIPVVIASVYRLPTRRDAPYDAIYALPAQLEAAGVRYCIGTDGRFGASMVRNLPYHAATAVAFGLSEAQALRAVTLSAAEIFGVEASVGSLDAGKDATLFVADGNILEIPTQVTHAWIQGRKVDLTSKHTQLYDKYKVRYERSPKP
jgi:imidazolonepropionase-like amidohydrolase